MPPKRGPRAGSRGGGRAASRTPGPQESTPASTFSTSYGSPAPLTSPRTLNSGSVSGALSQVLGNVNTANESSRVVRARAARIAAVQVANPNPERLPRNAQPGDSEADSTDSDDPQSDDDRSRMPPPPPPTRGPKPPASKAPVSKAPGLNGSGPKAPHPSSDNRSFTEEGGLYTGANLGTPRGRSSRSQTPSRSSARIAAKNGIANLPSPLAPQSSIEEDSDDLNEEDHDSNGSGVRRAYDPDLIDRMNQASRLRGADRPLIIDQARTAPPEPKAKQQGSNVPPPNLFNDRLKTTGPLRRLEPMDTTPKRNGQNGPDGSAANKGGQPNPRGGALNSGGQPSPKHGPLSNGGQLSPIGGAHNRGQPAPNGVLPNKDGQPDAGVQQRSMHWINHIWKTITQSWATSNWIQRLGYVFGLWAMLVALCAVWLIFLQVTLPPARWEGIRVGRNYTYTGLASFRQLIAQYIPWVILHPFAVLTGSLDYADFRTTLSWAELSLQSNEHAIKHWAGAIEQVRRILPELIAIQVNKESKTWKVSDEFWNALYSEMIEGGLHHTIPTIEASSDGSYSIADNHWSAIRSRILDEGLLGSEQPVDSTLSNIEQVNAIIDRSMSQRWAEWLHNNNDAIDRAQGATKEPMSAHWTKLFGDFEKKMIQRFESLNLEERIISRDEFVDRIRHVADEEAVQIRNEIQVLEVQVQNAIRIAETAKQTSELPAGMTREQLNEMMNTAVRNVVADAQLESIAKGNILSHLETHLLHQKNYFSTLRGAVIDIQRTSMTYKRGKRVIPGKDEINTQETVAGIVSRTSKAIRLGGKDSGVDFASGMALERWEEDGECWCAAHGDDNSTPIADLTIFTADIVIPQHLVVEHIAASGSFDAEAMPKDLEVWIKSPSGPAYRTLTAWSNEEFPGENDPKLSARGFVKIGEFLYDSDKGEKQVFKMSEKLLDFGAQTQHVLVRSTSNYGASDHTCFYRLRLFGEPGQTGEPGETY